MGKRLNDVPLRTLVQILRATERLVGAASPSVEILRRAVAAKKQAARDAKEARERRAPMPSQMEGGHA
jgi:hypothetical protein